jgi:hypothetical protein
MTGILANNLVSGIVICAAGKGCWRRRQQELALKTYLVAKAFLKAGLWLWGLVKQCTLLIIKLQKEKNETGELSCNLF